MAVTAFGAGSSEQFTVCSWVLNLQHLELNWDRADPVKADFNTLSEHPKLLGKISSPKKGTFKKPRFFLDWFFHIRRGAHTRKLSPTRAAEAARVAVTPFMLSQFLFQTDSSNPPRCSLKTPKIERKFADLKIDFEDL